MNKSLKPASTLVALAIGMAFSWQAAADTLSKDQVKAERERIEQQYDAAKRACDGRSGNAKDICLAEAKGNEKVAKAELKARNDATAEARKEARMARAEANYEVAKERCDDKTGNAKDVCIKDAKALLTKAQADAKVARAADANDARGRERVAEARRDANEDTREAQYRAARERCDKLAGDAKDQCQQRARTQYGR
jgi:hypothetical protein